MSGAVGLLRLPDPPELLEQRLDLPPCGLDHRGRAAPGSERADLPAGKGTETRGGALQMEIAGALVAEQRVDGHVGRVRKRATIIALGIVPEIITEDGDSAVVTVHPIANAERNYVV